MHRRRAYESGIVVRYIQQNTSVDDKHLVFAFAQFSHPFCGGFHRAKTLGKAPHQFWLSIHNRRPFNSHSPFVLSHRFPNKLNTCVYIVLSAQPGRDSPT